MPVGQHPLNKKKEIRPRPVKYQMFAFWFSSVGCFQVVDWCLRANYESLDCWAHRMTLGCVFPRNVHQRVWNKLFLILFIYTQYQQQQQQRLQQNHRSPKRMLARQ